MKKKKDLFAYILPCLWTAFGFGIIIYMAAASLSTSRDIFQGTVFEFLNGFHFENYKTAWSAQKLYLYFFNSLLYATVAVVFGLLMSAPASYVLSRYQFRGNQLIKSALIVAQSIPSILIILPIYGLFVQWNIKGRLALCVLYSCMRVPYCTTYLLNFFETISRTYEEAAAIDGCPDHKIFFHIMLPMVRPALATVALFSFLGVLNEYFISLLLVPTGDAVTLGVGLSRVIQQLQYSGNYPGIFAAVLIVMVPSIIIFAIFSRKIMYGGNEGGIKG